MAENMTEQFIKLAEHNQQNLWKRRQLLWRQNFLLWSGMAVVGAFIFANYEAINGMPAWGWWLLLGALCILVVMHLWHIFENYVSDEMDLEWIHYYKDQAELHVNPNIVARSRPKQGVSRYSYLVGPTGKLKQAKIAQLLPTMLMTVLIAASVAVLIGVLARHSTGRTDTGMAKAVDMARRMIAR